MAVRKPRRKAGPKAQKPRPKPKPSPVAKPPHAAAPPPQSRGTATKAKKAMTSGGGQGSPVVYSGGFTEVGPYRSRKSVTLDGSGNGQVQFDVRSSNQRYNISYVTVSTNQNPTTSPYPTATLYENQTQAGMSEGATWTGNQDTFAGTFIIDAGTDLIVRFTGGVAGSIATVVIDGTNELESTLAENYGYV